MEGYEKHEKELEAGRAEHHNSIKKYIEDLGLSIDDLKDQTILDVGSGSAAFAQACKAADLKCEVYSIDPSFSPEGEGASEAKKTFFQATGEHIPVKDNVVDLTISRFAVPMMINNPERMEQAIRDMARVTKEGGEIRFSPIDQVVYFPGTQRVKPTTREWWPDEALREKTEAILDKLEDEGYEVNVKSITRRTEDFDGEEIDLETTFVVIKKPKNEKAAS